MFKRESAVSQCDFVTLLEIRELDVQMKYKY